MMMIKFDVSELREVSIEELGENMFIEECDFEIDGKVESGVYKIEVGSRGEIEDISKVEVVKKWWKFWNKGVFEVESGEEFKKRMLEGYELYKDGVVINEKEIEEYKEELDEWVYVELDDGVVRMCESEESGYDIYRIKVDEEVDEEDVFENGELIIEDVSKDVDDDSGVLVYSYKGKYVVMNFDYGGSLCECDVYENLDEINC